MSNLKNPTDEALLDKSGLALSMILDCAAQNAREKAKMVRKIFGHKCALPACLANRVSATKEEKNGRD